MVVESGGRRGPEGETSTAGFVMERVGSRPSFRGRHALWDKSHFLTRVLRRLHTAPAEPDRLPTRPCPYSTHLPTLYPPPAPLERPAA